MERNTTNDRLLVRALAKGLDAGPEMDFTLRVLERIERQAKAAERREGRLLFAGALLCVLGVLVLGGVALSAYLDVGTFASLGAGVVRIWDAVSTAVAAPAAYVSQAEESVVGYGSLIAMYGALSVLFLMLGLAGMLLQRRYS